jgi:C4-dicarboxylate transporter DctQ subunit
MSAYLLICRAMTAVSVTLVALLALPITYDAVMRMTGHPTIWVFQITLYAFMAAGFLANPAAMKSGAHFRVTILHKLFPHLRRALDVFALLMTLLFSVILIGAGAYFVRYSWINNIFSDSLFEVPLWIPQLALPLGGLGLFLQTLAMLISGEAPGEEEEAAADVVGD